MIGIWIGVWILFARFKVPKLFRIRDKANRRLERFKVRGECWGLFFG